MKRKIGVILTYVKVKHSIKLCRDSIMCAHLNNGEYAEQWGALVLIHRGWSNKTETFEELVGVSAGWDTWGV